jgi:hypothetical protein
MAIFSRWLIKSKIFQKMLDNQFWDAHSVDIVYRKNGQDFREEADWLKDLWYCAKGRPDAVISTFRESKPEHFYSLEESHGSYLLHLHFRDLQSVTIYLGAERPDPNQIEERARNIHDRISGLISMAVGQALAEHKRDLRHLLGVKD